MKIYLSRENVEKLGILCSEVELVSDNNMILVNAGPALLTLIQCNNIPYYEDLLTSIYS